MCRLGLTLLTHLLGFRRWFLKLLHGQLTLEVDGQALGRVIKKLPYLNEPPFHFFDVHNFIIGVTTGKGELVANTVNTNQASVQLF